MAREIGAAEVVVVGSGIAGACVAVRAAAAGRRVLVVERGDWMGPRQITTIHRARTVRRTTAVPLISVNRVHAGKKMPDRLMPVAVGGLANFYAGVSLRIRDEELERWPVGPDAMRPRYAEAEELLSVATAPTRSAVADRLAAAADRIGVRAVANPLAIRFATPCRRCTHCNQVPCPWGAKFSPARLLRERGIEVLSGVTARRLVFEGDRAHTLEVTDATGEVAHVRCESAVAICAGAIESPRLLERSGVADRMPHVGKNLMTHILADIIGLFRDPVGEDRDFEKWLSFDAGYFDDQGRVRGLVQQEQPSPRRDLLARTPAPFRGVVGYAIEHMVSLIAIGEDDARPENRIATAADGAPVLHQRYTADEERRRAELVRSARKLLRASGAYATFAAKSHSVYHACGTARMGTSERDSVTDRTGRIWGTANVFVGDASLFPTSSGVNPSLTIAALGLHVGGGL